MVRVDGLVPRRGKDLTSAARSCGRSMQGLGAADRDRVGSGGGEEEGSGRGRRSGKKYPSAAHVDPNGVGWWKEKRELYLVNGHGKVEVGQDEMVRDAFVCSLFGFS